MQKKELFSSLKYVNQLADVSTWEFVSWNKVPHLENINRFFFFFKRSVQILKKYYCEQWKGLALGPIPDRKEVGKKRNHLVSMATVLVEIVVWAYWTCIKAFPREVRGFEERRKKKKDGSHCRKHRDILCWISVSHLWCDQ